SFGKYIREQEEWVAPALLLRAPDIFEFQTQEEISGTQFGVLSLPRIARKELQILDGQHRILGIHLGLEEISGEISSKRAELAKAKKNGQAPEVIRHFEEKIAQL